MIVEVKLPELSEDINNATLTFWHFEEGNTVNEGDDLVEMTTDKATFNIPAPKSGVLEKKFFQEGDMVNTGDVVAHIREE